MDPDQDHIITDPDPDPEDPKTYGSYVCGSGSGPPVLG
jgi:hypothetical protein